MRRHLGIFLPLAGAVLLAGAGSAQAGEPTWSAVEYESRATLEYRFARDLSEAGALEPAHSGWRRTGAVIHAYADPEGEFTVPVCRASAGAHMGFAIGAADCPKAAAPSYVRANEVFFLAKANAAGSCGTNAPVWLLRHSQDKSLVARIGVGAIAPGMGVPKSGVVWGLCAPKTARMQRMDAARLLDQGTFGPTAALVDRVASLGAERWIAEQLSLPATRYTQYATYYRPTNFFDANCTYNLADGTPAPNAAQQCARQTFGPELVQREFFWQATEGADQLRQRVAWAWSQLFVVSGVKEGMAYGMADYQQRLRDMAFSRFDELLYMVATHPMMGRMLDNLGNSKASGPRVPNENFARELLQLFTTGTVRLNPDGSPVLGADGQPVALYSQETISELARALTGWVEAPSTPPEGRRPGNLRDAMVVNSNNHDTGSKRLFGGELVIPAGLDAETEMRRVTRFLAEHPNTSVFISRYLIQRLVTSNPSGAYLERVSGVFRNNGNGVVGDLRAVVTAILLDPEARGASRPEESYGRLRDNVQRYVGLLRAIETRNFKDANVQLPWTMNASPFNAPTVFGFFLADYEVDTGLYGPEFNANRMSTVLDWAGRSAQLLAQDIQNWNFDPPVQGSSSVARYVAMGGDIPGLLDELNMTFAGGSVSPVMLGAMSSMLSSFRPWGGSASTEFVARSALFTFFNSAQYHVQR